jgi:hypothetical protein
MDRTVYHMIRRGMGSEALMERLYLTQRGRAPRVRPVHHVINERAPYRRILDKYARDGKIGVHRSGMDCDCTQYSHSSIIDAPVGAIQFQMREELHYEWLDGPESTSWSLPENTIVQHRSLDLALRAYEDGHPSTVYVVDESELIAH